MLLFSYMREQKSIDFHEDTTDFAQGRPSKRIRAKRKISIRLQDILSR